MNKKNRFVTASGAILAIAVALLFSDRLSAGEDDAKAEKAIKDLGGQVTRDEAGRAIVVVKFQGKGMTDAGLKELAGLKSLMVLDLWGTQVTDAGLKELAGLKNLQSLDLNFTEVTATPPAWSTKIMNRVLVVPWSMAPTNLLIAWFSVAAVGSQHPRFRHHGGGPRRPVSSGHVPIPVHAARLGRLLKTPRSEPGARESSRQVADPQVSRPPWCLPVLRSSVSCSAPSDSSSTPDRSPWRRLTDRPRQGRPILPRLNGNGRVLLAAYRTLALSIRDEGPITPAAEWLVDNFHIVEEQVREIRDDLPDAYYRELPNSLRFGGGRGRGGEGGEIRMWCYRRYLRFSR